MTPPLLNALTAAALLSLLPVTTAQDAAGTTGPDVPQKPAERHWPLAPPRAPAETGLTGPPSILAGPADPRPSGRGFRPARSCRRPSARSARPPR
jgi:hypothetical protein